MIKRVDVTEKTVEEIEMMNANGWEIEINNGKVIAMKAETAENKINLNELSLEEILAANEEGFTFEISNGEITACINEKAANAVA